jgi:hypothetical protein
VDARNLLGLTCLLAGCSAAAPAIPSSPEGPSCAVLRSEGVLAAGEGGELLRLALEAGDRLVVVLEAEPPEAVTISLAGPAAANDQAGPDPVVWTEFARPLPPGTERCPATGCGPLGGSYWTPPRLDRRVGSAGEYRVRLQAEADRSVRWSACVDVVSSSASGGATEEEEP